LRAFFLEDLPDGVVLPTRPLETTVRWHVSIVHLAKVQCVGIAYHQEHQ
jgi:hypothetical protein